MLRKYNLLFLLLILFIINTTTAQELPITGGDITSCSGFLVDSGASAGEYSANEDITITICPEAPETIINLDFFVFDLGEGDEMTIYDGSTTSDPLIGVYTNNDIQSTDITSTNGCLTIQWSSDGTENGNFGAEISCGAPCVAPIVVIENEQEVPILGCPGTILTFDGSNSEFFNDGIIGSFSWDLGDGTIDTESWPTISHEYTEPGGYVIELYITDSNGCESTNFVSLVVLIATEPEVNIELESPVCLGSDASYDVEAVYQPTAWTQISGGISGGEIYIPDDQTQSFSSTIEVTGFSPLDVIDEASDLDYFFINFEHSFMGDLVIQFECPNGQTITVHQQQGGGTQLGVPDQDDGTGPGTGYDYWWTSDSNNGTWETESASYTTLPSGEYQSVQPWSNLNGCPLNGVWTIEITDMWGADDGYIFDWSLAFDPELNPNLINFTPSIGGGADSTFWEINPTITSTTDDGNGLTLSFEETGVYEYIYTLVDNFGCTYSQDYQIEVLNGPIADAGEDIILCNEDGSLEASVTVGESPFNSAIYQWTPSNNLSSSSILTPNVVDLSNTATYIFSTYPVGNPQCVTTDSVIVTVMDLPNTGDDTDLVFCPTNDTINLFNEISGTPDLNGIWLGTNDSLVSEFFTPAFDDNQIFYYSFPDCDVNSEITVTVNHLDINISTDTTICHNGTAEFEVELLNTFIGDANYMWDNNLTDSPTVYVSPEEPTIYTVYVSYGDDCITESHSVLTNYHEPLSTTITSSQTLCHNESIELTVLDTEGGLLPYSFQWANSNIVLSDTTSYNASPVENTTYCLTVSDACESSPETVCTDILVENLINPDFNSDFTSGCYPVTTLFTPIEVEQANIQAEFWDFGDGTQSTESGTVTNQYSIYGDFSVTHTIISIGGCSYTSTSDTIVHVYPYPLASFSPMNEVQVLPYTNFSFINHSVGNDNNYWNFIDNNNQHLGESTDSEPNFTFPTMEIGEYLVTLLVENEHGCSDTASRTIEVFEDFILYAPTAITANDDGINDIFYVTGIDIDPENFSLTIFNRWGTKLFQSKDINYGWNGDVNTGEYYSKNDNYMYVVETKSLSSGDKKIITGYITIFR